MHYASSSFLKLNRQVADILFHPSSAASGASNCVVKVRNVRPQYLFGIFVHELKDRRGEDH
eukprot:7387813-Prymnesium_polylepis.1